jgi:hypothetical protein
MRAVLKSVMITAIEDQRAAIYLGDRGDASEDNPYASSENSKSGNNSWRFPIHAAETLKAFDRKFENGGMFRSAAEICSMFLYPAQQPSVDSPNDSAIPLVYWDAGDGNNKNWWYAGPGTFCKSITGDIENGGCYNHVAGFKGVADCLLGRAEGAWETFRKIAPDNPDNPVAHSEMEPFAFVNLFFAHEYAYGKAFYPWRTGTAAWFVILIVEWILGARRHLRHPPRQHGRPLPRNPIDPLRRSTHRRKRPPRPPRRPPPRRRRDLSRLRNSPGRVPCSGVSVSAGRRI